MSDIVLMDGGMGQELVKRSQFAPSPLWSTQVLMDEPDIVEAAHLDFINSGARVITINSYTLTPQRLARDGNAEMFSRLQSKALVIANSAREKSGRDITITGCLPPLVASYRSDLIPDFETCLESYRRIVAEQAEGVDLFLCETLSSTTEIRAATLAAAESGKPVWTAMTLADELSSEGKTDPRLRSGDKLTDAIKAAKDAGAAALLINCSWPETISRSIGVMAEEGLPFGAYANGFSAVDPLQPGGTVATLTARSDLDPAAYAEHAMSWVEQGATIVGGCCETGPLHIEETARRLKAENHQIVGAFKT